MGVLIGYVAFSGIIVVVCFYGSHKCSVHVFHKFLRIVELFLMMFERLILVL